MSAKGKAAMKAGKAAKKVIHPPYLKVTIAAGKASAAHPLGPQLGQRGIQIGPFCKQFNDQTKEIKEGLPLPTAITVNPDRTFTIAPYNPSTAFLLKRAAGAKRGGVGGSDVAGKVSLKHVYEIAKIKIKDPPMFGYTLEEVCKQIIGTAHSCGIDVVKKIDPKEYAEFLEKRQNEIQEHEDEMEEIRQAKLLRL